MLPTNRSSHILAACFAGFVAALLLSSVAMGSVAVGKHPFTVHDMLAMDRISDPQLSPAGDRVAFVVRKTDLEQNKGRFDIWMVNTDGSGLRQLTTNPASDQNPRWDPDGRHLWFLSTRSGSSQVWKLPLEGGEAVQVTDLPLDVDAMVVAPDGKNLILAINVFPDCESLPCTKKRLDERKESKSTGVVYDQLLVRHWDTWEDGRYSHLFALPTASGKEPVDLMRGMEANCPSRPFGGTEEIGISPDGTTVVFSAKNVGRSAPWSTDFDLFAVPIDGSSAPRSLTEDNQAWDTAPTFSPDGRTLAYLAMSRPGFESDRFRVMLRPWPEGKAHELAPSWDRSPGSISWTQDGRYLLAAAENLGQASLFRIDASSGQVSTLQEQGTVSSALSAGNKVIFAMDDLQSPVELYSVNLDGTGTKAVTELNADKVAAAKMGAAEQFTFKGWNDETVYCYVVKPIDFDSSKKYPVAFLIHGGPQGSFGNHFHYRWNPEVYSGAGYAAVMVDFHGSTGYGQAFTDSISRDWGGKPLIDLQKGLAAALQKYPWMDGDRVAALGASYGGYMINWIAGQWPDRFRCLVNHDGPFDLRSMYYTTEELWFPEWEQAGPYWKHPEEYEKFNPVLFVDKWKSPMLVIHGANDFRVPLGQGLGAFTALQRQGIPSRFLYFPDESHWVQKPANSIQWHEEVLGWLARWMK
jgi:dipeptidyl aminopeptidase/acylaminoacyl peptidase